MRRRWIPVALTLLGLCGWNVLPEAAAQGRRSRRGRRARKARKVDITVSRETTYITGPLNADGTVNYVAYLNAKYGKGVTKDNNAFVLLAQALGPEFVPSKVRSAVYQRLHIPLPPTNGKHFRRLDERYFRGKEKDPKAAAKAAKERLDDARFDAWQAKDDPVLAAWIAINEEPLKLVIAASHRSRYFYPITSTSEPPCAVDLLAPNSRNVREAVKALAARATLRLGAGDAAGAWSDVQTGWRLARLFGQGMSLVERLTAVAIEAIATETCITMAASEKLTAAEARRFLEQLRRLPGLPDAWDVLNSGERFVTLDLITTIARDGPSVLEPIMGQGDNGEDWGKLPLLRIKWDPTLRGVNSRFDALVVAGTKPTFAARKKVLDAWEVDRQRLAGTGGRVIERFGGSLFACIRNVARASRARGANKRMLGLLMGPVFTQLALPSPVNAVLLHERVRATGVLAVVSMALAAHRAEKGAYPADLRALSPTYLKTIPKDRFNGKPLIYRRKSGGYILYSVGSNLKHDGGKDDFKTGDVVVDTTED